MKELSIEEKAKAYDEAIEKFDVILNLNTVKKSGTIFADDVRKIFPELKKSKVEPKFHEGEWITNGDYTWKIVDVKLLDYILQSQDGNIVDDTISHVDEQFHSFTMEDAKDGDVLVTQKTDVTYKSIFIFKKIENNRIIQYLHYFTTDADEEVCEARSINGFLGFVETPVHPATKEQCDLLFKKMHEVGYEWDAEKKELKKSKTNYK